jgi:glyoxylase-like metal-dependent hydrolase (beta-lactamase superfamily II)
MEDVRHILVTHLHPDHFGSLIALKEARLMYPQAHLDG